MTSMWSDGVIAH